MQGKTIEIVVDICGGRLQAIHAPRGVSLRVVERNFDESDPEDRRTHLDADGSMYRRTVHEHGQCGWPCGDHNLTPANCDGSCVGTAD